MTPDERENSYSWITSHCTFGVGSVDASEIDRIGILAATEIAMQRAVAAVANVSRNLYLLVDGRDKFWFDFPHSSIIRGDDSEPCIGAASIIAKVTRDRFMTDLHKSASKYGFDEHKGYGTPDHFAAIRKHGISNMHRKTFLKEWI
jgi:ribonuclease HII